MEKAIEQQCEFIASLKDKEPLQSKEEIEREVVVRLNSISQSLGLKSPYFSHNGFDYTYCSLYCSCCKYRKIVWFNYKTSLIGEPKDITFYRQPHGFGMHLDIDSHINVQLPILP